MRCLGVGALIGAVDADSDPFGVCARDRGRDVLACVVVALSAIAGRRKGTTAQARNKMPLWPLAPVAVILSLDYVTYQLWKGNPWQVLIAVGALAIGYAHYYLYLYLYLYPQRPTRWTMPAAAHDEHALDAVGALLMGPALEIEPPPTHHTTVVKP